MRDNNQDCLSFGSLKLIEIPVKFEGEEETFLLREASESASVAYRNAMMAESKIEGKKVTSIGNFLNSELTLLSQCLFRVIEQEGMGSIPSPVSEQFVKDLPARIANKLVDKIREISDLDEEDSIEGIKEQIKILQERLVELEAGESSTKNS